MRPFKIQVGSLLPGTFASNFYGLSKRHYIETFQAILQQPELEYTHWPIYEPWNAAHLAIFGRENSPESSWGWPGAAAHFYRLLISWQRHGYQPELAIGAEHAIQAVHHDDQWCVVQGNKRVALLQLYGGAYTKVVVTPVERFMPEGIQ